MGLLEKELRLKADLLTEGIDAQPTALAGMGEIYKEQNHGLFGWDFENHPGVLLPDDFVFPGGTVVQFRKRSGSPYQINHNRESLYLEKNGVPVSRVEWLPRPRFYSQKTSDGVPMNRVAQVGGQDNFFLCYNNYCSHWKDNQQCLFCNLVSTKKTYQSVLSRKKLDQIGETASAAFAEGMVKHMLMTGGCFPGENETEIVVSILNSIKQHTGMTEVPGCVLASPPNDLTEIDRLREAGIQGVGYSLEIWDRRFFHTICPGKAISPGYDKFLETLEYAVKVFGRGNVFCAFVTGIEPRETLLQGVDYLAQRGIYSLCFVWSPAPGSKLEGHRAPTGQWYFDTNKAIVDLFAKYQLPPTTMHCYRCDGNTLFHDEARRRQTEDV